ncbi:MAG: hypothetical protein M3N13_10725 [Candidatus Eremiobacteraeota bacterium]|nr:hypothetical protein [Candidatus Eremiobacteraeota bacterium]
MKIESNVVFLFWREPRWTEVTTSGSTLFSPEHVSYLLKRSAETKNPLFAAFYAIAAWLAQRRREYAQIAVEAAMKAVVEFSDCPDASSAFGGLRRVLPLAYGVSSAAGQADAVRESLFQLTRDLRKPFGIIRWEIARLLTDDKRTPLTILGPLSDIVGEIITELATNDLDVLRGLALLGKRIDAKLQAPQEAKWDRRLGDALSIWVEAHPENIAKSLGAQEAAAAFSRAGEQTKAMAMREITRASIQSQDTVTIELPFENVEETLLYLRQRTRTVFEEFGATEVMRLLAESPHVIPSDEEVNNIQEKMELEGVGSFMSMVSSHTVTDDRIVDHATVGDGQRRRAFLQTYDIAIHHSRMAVDAFVQELVVSEEISLDDIMMFVARSYVGRRTPRTPEIEEPLLTLLRPALRTWLEICSRARDADELILVGDSLTPKIETILRKMAVLLGVAEIKAVDRGGKIVDELRGLEIAEDPVMQATLGADLVEFLRYVLDSDGEGFRDRLAHGATRPHEYRFECTGLIVLLLLRLCGCKVLPITTS